MTTTPSSPTSPTPPPATPDIDLLEPADPDFFDRHKHAIIWGSIAVVVLIVLGGMLQLMRQSSRIEAAEQFSSAKSTEDLEKVIATHGGLFEANARLLLAARHREDGAFDEAQALLDGFESKFPKHPLISQAALSQAAILEAKGDLAAAAAAYRQIATQYPDSAAAPYALLSEGRMLRLTDKPEEARKVLESAITRYPGTAPVQEAIQEIELLPPAPVEATAPTGSEPESAAEATDAASTPAPEAAPEE